MCAMITFLETNRYHYEHVSYELPKPKLTGFFFSKYGSRADVVNRTFSYYSKMKQEMCRISSGNVENAPFFADEQTMKTICQLPYNPNKYVFVVSMFYGKIFCQIELRPPGEKWIPKIVAENVKQEPSEKKETLDEQNNNSSKSKAHKSTSTSGGPSHKNKTKDEAKLITSHNLQGVYEMDLKGHLVMYVYRISSILSPEGNNLSFLQDQNEGFAYLNRHKFVNLHTSGRQEYEKAFRNTIARCIWIDTLLSRSMRALVKFSTTMHSKQYTLRQLDDLKMNWEPSVLINFAADFVSFVKYCVQLEIEKMDYIGDIRNYPPIDFYLVKEYGYDGGIFPSLHTVTLDQKVLPNWYINSFINYLQNQTYP